MNTDKELLASEKQAITATTVSTDSILVRNLPGISRARNMRAIAQIETALSGGAATSVTVELIQADDGALTTNVESLASSGAIATAAAVAGKRALDVALPEFTKPYAGFRYTMAGGNYAAGKVTAGFVIGTETPQASRPEANSSGF